jgi:hypothetical protein
MNKPVENRVQEIQLMPAFKSTRAAERTLLVGLDELLGRVLEIDGAPRDKADQRFASPVKSRVWRLGGCLVGGTGVRRE